MGYCHEDDTLFVRVTDRAAIEVTTKREMLRLVHSVWDPFGLAGPVILPGRLFFQVANQLGGGWDDPLPKEILDPFNKWRKTIPELKKIRIPRWTSSPEFDEDEEIFTDLIIFCDASKDAFGVVVYIRRYYKSGRIAFIALIFSKCHVVPSSMHKTKILNQEDHGGSIPKLELTAARLAALVRDQIVRESGEKYANIYMFTDSLTVLNWIADFDRKFKTFENFRIQKIRQLTDVADWRHVPSKENPADICSHGINADDEAKWSFFLHGPDWLAQNEEFWPPVRPPPKEDIDDPIAMDAISTFTPHFNGR